jgi:hypothetical protein
MKAKGKMQKKKGQKNMKERKLWVEKEERRMPWIYHGCNGHWIL